MPPLVMCSCTYICTSKLNTQARKHAYSSTCADARSARILSLRFICMYVRQKKNMLSGPARAEKSQSTNQYTHAPFRAVDRGTLPVWQKRLLFVSRCRFPPEYAKRKDLRKEVRRSQTVITTSLSYIRIHSTTPYNTVRCDFAHSGARSKKNVSRIVHYTKPSSNIHATPSLHNTCTNAREFCTKAQEEGRNTLFFTPERSSPASIFARVGRCTQAETSKELPKTEKTQHRVVASLHVAEGKQSRTL